MDHRGFFFKTSVAVGMASLENVVYVFNSTLSGGLFAGFITAILRAILAVPLHASLGVIIGADVSR